jgi:hypothetical protein
MSINNREEYRLTSADLVYSGKTTVQAAAPTLATHGYRVTDDGLKGVRYLRLLGMSRNAADNGAGAAAINVTPYFYVPDMVGTVKWVATSTKVISLDATILADATGATTNQHKIEKPAGATRVAFATNAAFGGDTVMHLAIIRDT